MEVRRMVGDGEEGTQREDGRPRPGQEASFRLTRGHGPCAVGHSPTLLCASQDVRSGKSEELEKWAGDVRGWGNRKGKQRSQETPEGGGRMECQGWSRGAGGRKWLIEGWVSSGQKGETAEAEMEWAGGRGLGGGRWKGRQGMQD